MSRSLYADEDHSQHHRWKQAREKLAEVVEREAAEILNDLYGNTMFTEDDFLDMLADAVMPVVEQLERDLY